MVLLESHNAIWVADSYEPIFLSTQNSKCSMVEQHQRCAKRIKTANIGIFLPFRLTVRVMKSTEMIRMQICS